MSFQEYLKFMMGHYTEKMNQSGEQKQKRNKSQTSTLETWFGLFPFSIKLLLKK